MQSAPQDTIPLNGMGPMPFERSAALLAAASRPLSGTLPDALMWAASVQVDGFEILVTTEISAVSTLWQSIEAEANLSAFQTYGWLSTWQDHVGGQQGTLPVIAVIYDKSHRALCLLPLSLSGTRLRKLKWLGSDLCDYNAPVIARDFAERCSTDQLRNLWKALVNTLQASPEFRFDLCDFEKMPERIGDAPNPMLALPVMHNASSAHLASLGTDWDTFYAERRSSSTRKKERKQLKQLGEYGDVRFSTVTERADIDATLDILFAQKEATFKRMGVENVFAKTGYRAFFEKLASDPATAGLVHLSRLDVGDIPAAASYGLMLDGCYYLIISSYTDHELSKLGPGRVHLAELMSFAMEKNITTFDFTIGDESYKRLWADIQLPIYDHSAGYSLRGMAVSLGVRGYRLLKRTIKQNPKLWEVYTNLRVLIGG